MWPFPHAIQAQLTRPRFSLGGLLTAQRLSWAPAPKHCSTGWHQAGWRAARRAAPGRPAPGAQTARTAPRTGPSRGRPPGWGLPAPALALRPMCACRQTALKALGRRTCHLRGTVCQARVYSLFQARCKTDIALAQRLAGFTYLRDVVRLQREKVVHQQSRRALQGCVWSCCCRWSSAKAVAGCILRVSSSLPMSCMSL